MGYKTVPNVLESVWMLSKLGVFWVRIGTQNLNYKEIDSKTTKRREWVSIIETF